MHSQTPRINPWAELSFVLMPAGITGATTRPLSWFHIQPNTPARGAVMGHTLAAEFADWMQRHAQHENALPIVNTAVTGIMQALAVQIDQPGHVARCASLHGAASAFLSDLVRMVFEASQRQPWGRELRKNADRAALKVAGITDQQRRHVERLKAARLAKRAARLQQQGDA